MKVHLNPTGLYSRAMVRIARALEHYLPPGLTVTSDMDSADLVILHVIDDATTFGKSLVVEGREYVVIQYCLDSTSIPDPAAWTPFWANARLVWSYYDLSRFIPDTRFFHAPLGVDEVFTNRGADRRRERRIITTGYVSGPNSEAIEEVWRAAEEIGIEAIHVGTSTIKGMDTTNTPGWKSWAPTDSQLAELYRTSTWVAGLRHCEGFELPAAEGLACGAHALVFDQPAMRYWYTPHATFVPECSGDELVAELVAALTTPRSPVNRQDVIDRFNWRVIASEFWRRVAL